MQIIQSIRDKGAAITISVIAISLIGFILMDAKSGNNKMFGSSQNSSIATVNGSDIDLKDFNKRVDEAILAEKQNQNQYQGPKSTYQIKDQVWNQMVALKVFYAEASKLGIDFTPEEWSHFLYSNEQSNPLLQHKELLDSVTNKLDPQKVAQLLKDIKKPSNPNRAFFDAEIEKERQNSIVAKYNGLLNAAANYPGWMQERDNTNAKNFATISYVSIPYNVIPDSTVSVSDADIESFVRSNKKKFKQEEGLKISYVTFSQNPKAEDSIKTRAEVEALKSEFATKTDSTVAAFLAKNNSKIGFEDEYMPKSKIKTSNIDSVLKQPFGTVVGPYADGGNYTIAKIFGSKPLPDSVKARHILFPLQDAQGQPTDPVASKKMADSILKLIKGGASFAALAMQYGTDGTKDKGGDLGTFGYGAMVPEFNKFCFTKPVGTLEVLKTRFGYHVLEILNQKNFNPAYKIALMSKEINAGENTLNAATQDAIKLSATKNRKEFEAYIAKNGLQKVALPGLVKQTDDQVGNLQSARQLVNWAYGAKVGDVSEPFLIGDNQVVALVENAYEEGTQDAKTARALAERDVKNKKIAEMIIKNIGSNPTLEAAAAKYPNIQVQTAGQDSSIIYSSPTVKGLNEPKLVGASFNKEYQSKPSAPIAGNTGVYLVKVNGIAAKAADTPDEIAAKQKSQAGTLRQQFGNWYEGLKNQATIKDRRAKVNY
jgi:peptidyl-prolyl cis-trans isomerase D